MPDWAQIISDTLDILKFDGAVQDTLAETSRKMGRTGPGGYLMNALIPLAFNI